MKREIILDSAPSGTKGTATEVPPASAWMAAVPANIRGRIRSGMRWTVWLTALAVPFSYGSKILLARVSPEAIGAYGLLLVYVGVTSCLFYFGGDAVVIKFLPETDRSERASFLFTYFLVICGSLVPWLVLAALLPKTLHYLFGREASPVFLVLVLCLAPIPILFSLIQAVLKADLDFRRAQLLARTVTIGSFLTYGALFLFQRRWLVARPAEILWSVYVALTAVGLVLGLRSLRRSSFVRDPRERLRLRFRLPRGFWAFAFGTQSISFITLLQRVDLILVLNFGGMKTLGQYVAITTLALTIPLVNRFFYDTLLPSLTNLLATGNTRGAEEVFRAHMRLLLLVIAGGTCGLIFLASPLLAIFGPTYKTLGLPVLALAALIGLASPGATGGTLLSAIGKPHRAASISLLQAGLNVALFFALWPRFQLLGAALALGISQLVGALLVFVIAASSVPFRTGMLSGWTRLGFVVAGAAGAAWHWRTESWAAGLLECSLSVLFFLLVGRYRWTDCRELWNWVMPDLGGTARETSTIGAR